MDLLDNSYEDAFENLDEDNDFELIEDLNEYKVYRMVRVLNALLEKFKLSTSQKGKTTNNQITIYMKEVRKS